MSARQRSEDDEGGARIATLMGQYCDGNRASFDEIYAILAPRILGYLTGLVKDRAAAEDLLQLTFIKLHQHRDVYIRGANPVPWLYTIAHRTCLDELRRRKRSRVRVSVDGNLPHDPPVDIDGSAEPPQEGVDEQMIARGMEALAGLPETQRQAVLLTKIHGHSIADAASILGTTVGAIKLRAHRGYVALRRKLTAEVFVAPTGAACDAAREQVLL
jgi:RNA polymerase sigma-70 factor, ECF subfamily